MTVIPSTKSGSFILSASGISNIPVKNENSFRFIFGSHEITLNRINADFISPIVSSLHNTDSNANSFQFGDLFQKIPQIQNFNPISPTYTRYEDIIDTETIENIKSISNGKSVDLNGDHCHKIRLISIIFGNQSMYDEIKQYMKQHDIFVSDIDKNMEYLLYFHYCSKNFGTLIMDSEIIEFISGQFYSIDKQKLLALPRSILFEIISNQHLKIENENLLFEFINSIYAIKNYYNEDILISHFYEKVRFSSLNEKKTQEFAQKFDFKLMTNELWKNYSSSNNRSVYFSKPLKEEHFNRYIYGNYQLFPYDENTGKGFEGIIFHLTKKFGENIHDKNIVCATASSLSYGTPKNLLILNDSTSYFYTQDQPNSWVQYDFVDSKVRPTHYSIMSTSQYGKIEDNPQTWVILGSDTGNDDDWTELDSRENISCLDDINQSHTFSIQNPSKKDEHFRYLRLKQTGDSSGPSNKNLLQLSALEFYGSIITKR